MYERRVWVFAFDLFGAYVGLVIYVSTGNDSDTDNDNDTALHAKRYPHNQMGQFSCTIQHSGVASFVENVFLKKSTEIVSSDLFACYALSSESKHSI